MSLARWFLVRAAAAALIVWTIGERVPARVLIISTMLAPELSEYPDSGKVGVRSYAFGAEPGEGSVNRSFAAVTAWIISTARGEPPKRLRRVGSCRRSLEPILAGVGGVRRPVSKSPGERECGRWA